MRDDHPAVLGYRFAGHVPGGAGDGGPIGGDARVTDPATSRPARHTEKAMLGRFTRRVVEFLKGEDGPTAVEYAVMLALIIVVIFAAVSNIGGTTSGMYNDLSLQGVKPGGTGS